MYQTEVYCYITVCIYNESMSRLQCDKHKMYIYGKTVRNEITTLQTNLVFLPYFWEQNHYKENQSETTVKQWEDPRCVSTRPFIYQLYTYREKIICRHAILISGLEGRERGTRLQSLWLSMGSYLRQIWILKCKL